MTFIFIFIFILEYWRKYKQKQRSPNAICKKDSNKETTKTAPQNKVSVPIIYFGFFRNTDFFKKRIYLIAPSICIFHNEQEVLPKLIVPIYVDPTTAMEEMNARIKEYWRKYRQKQRSPNAICNRDSNTETTKTAPQNKVSVCIIYFGYFRNADFFKKTNVSDCSIHFYFSY